MIYHGNILTQIRNNRQGTTIDSLTYKYRYNSDNKLIRNRLYHLKDAVHSSNFSDDIDDQGVFEDNPQLIETANNYVRDKMGRLVKDKQEYIDTILWTATNKVKAVIKTPSDTLKNVYFDYDAFGNQIAKHVYNAQTLILEKSTYYLLDAQSNQLSIYEHSVDETENTTNYYLTERNIYGSSRLGVAKDTVNMFNPNVLPSYGIVGNRNYELTDHRNNIYTVINDIKYPISDDNTTISGFGVGIAQITDYSPFGVELDGRTIQNSNYRYSFQNQEKHDEIKGKGNFINYKYRGADPRIGRLDWLIDPLAPKYPELTPYQFSSNRVLDGVELEGLEWKPIRFNDGDDKEKYSGFQWDPENAYNDDGNLKEGYYKQALSFIEIPNKFDKNSNFNMGSAILIVYGEDGSISGMDATTYPADMEQHAVVKSGELYEAVWGLHHGKGPALNLRNTYDVPSYKKGRIPIEQDKHPRFPEQFDSEVGGAYATGINIHWGFGASGKKATTGFDSKGNACSTGCQLVGGNYNDYQTDFIPKLTKGEKVGVTIYRPKENK